MLLSVSHATMTLARNIVAAVFRYAAAADALRHFAATPLRHDAAHAAMMSSLDIADTPPLPDALILPLPPTCLLIARCL